MLAFAFEHIELLLSYHIIGNNWLWYMCEPVECGLPGKHQ